MEMKERMKKIKNDLGNWVSDHKSQLLFYGGMAAGIATTIYGTLLADRILYDPECKIRSIVEMNDEKTETKLSIYRFNRFGGVERTPKASIAYEISDEKNSIGRALSAMFDEDVSKN